MGKKVRGFDLLVEHGHDKVERDGTRVSFVDLGEGWNGDYDPNDPRDQELLRFDIARRDADGEWEMVQDGSYCTRMPTDAPEATLRAALEYILDEVCALPHIKRRAEELSWIEPGSPGIAVHLYK